MKRFLTLLAIALIGIAPAIVFRLSGWRPNPVLDMAVFGVAVLAAGFMLSWGAEAAEKRISQGLILALVALVTVLPEYAVDMYYAYQAGKAPEACGAIQVAGHGNDARGTQLRRLGGVAQQAIKPEASPQQRLHASRMPFR